MRKVLLVQAQDRERLARAALGTVGNTPWGKLAAELGIKPQ